MSRGGLLVIFILPMKEIKPTQKQRTLDERRVDPNPIKQFQQWYEEAVAANQPMPDAMTLATSTHDGRPSARVVLLKGVTQEGFVFFTNYNSRKSKELVENPRASLVFYWPELLRQVRVDGTVDQVTAEESDAYFQTRPRDSQIGALVSPQSQIITSREELERKAAELAKLYEHRSIPRPPHWGGYRLKPISIEFWQWREARLHDRILYELQKNGGWKISRLAP